jgi:uncharacterized membrane protein YhaH (DUF805 family)
MHKPFHDILHPPELQGRERRRYWIAVGGWFVFTIGGIVFYGSILLSIAKYLERTYGDKFMMTAFGLADEWLLAVMLPLVVISVFGGDYLWGKAFVKSGYLSPAAAIRIRTNRAPTARGERIHRRLSLTYAALIPLLLMGVAWYLETYWLIPVVLVLGAWFVLMIWAGWQRADDMMAGEAPYPEDEVKRVLHDIDPDPNRDSEHRVQ